MPEIWNFRCNLNEGLFPYADKKYFHNEIIYKPSGVRIRTNQEADIVLLPRSKIWQGAE